MPWPKGKPRNPENTVVNRGEREEPDAYVEARSEALPITPAEVEAILREEALANALPNPPQIPGWHTCWLSTTNQYVPVQHYIRLGYVPVKPEEIVGWNYLKQHSAQIDSHVTCNEMILYKVPQAAWQQIMKTLHHDKPNEEAERLRANVDLMKTGSDFRDSEGNSLVKEEGDGMQSLVDRRVRVGRFSE